MSCRMGKSMDRMEFPYGKYCPAGIYLWRNSRSSHRRFSVKEGVLRNFTKFTEKHLCQSLFFNRVTLAQVFSWEFCEISKNIFFTEHLPTTANFWHVIAGWVRVIKVLRHTLRKKCSYLELLRSIFSRIRTKYREILRISLYLVRMRENTDQNNVEYGGFSRSDILKDLLIKQDFTKQCIGIAELPSYYVPRNFT